MKMCSRCLQPKVYFFQMAGVKDIYEQGENLVFVSHNIFYSLDKTFFYHQTKLFLDSK